jgi:drug/metabolite transporter (DMT)-like permease
MTQNTRLGIWLMIATVFVFATQDALSRHLAESYNTLMIVMIRYWFFAVFVIALAARKSGGLRNAARTHHPVLQPVRGILLAAEVCVMVYAFTKLGLINAHAVFTATPLLVAALSGPILGERVGWRRWAAILLGCVGVLIALGPGTGVFTLYALIPALSAAMFAVYSLLTRYVGRQDRTETSFFWTGTVGAVFMTLVGVWFWQPMSATDWGWMAMYCATASLSHWLLIKCYEVAEASAVQPFAYLHLVFAAGYGIVIFNDDLRWNVVLGAAIVVAAGLFTIWRERVARLAQRA